MSTSGFTLYDMIHDFWRTEKDEFGERYLAHTKWELLILAIDIAKRAKEDIPPSHHTWDDVCAIMNHACNAMRKGFTYDDIPDS